MSTELRGKMFHALAQLERLRYNRASADLIEKAELKHTIAVNRYIKAVNEEFKTNLRDSCKEFLGG